MKLRNKKTGEINLGDLHLDDFNSLAELNEEWEDAQEEPKEYFYIYADGNIYKDVQDDLREDNGCKEIGNYFETSEQAEKVVEKLKAFKRLKDLGFKFEGVRFRNNHNYIEWKIEAKNELTDDEIGKLLENLYKVFGGEDESNK